MKLVINTDGASRGNPGPAAYGFIIKDGNGMILHEEGRVIGVETNNIAEYMGAFKALEYVKERLFPKAPHQILFQADSQLVIRQLAGIYKIKNPKLKEIYQKIIALLPDLGEIEFRHVPREENFIPDKLANRALDS
jgi:ribonuclease HI